jgi:membrane associated rhomboid family serine protease
MLVWFVLCLVKIIPNVANTVHGIGLAVGVVWGCLASMPVFRSRL